ncbi:hypothetical protein SMACR_01407 [Sordaria macrospora]|uniref:Uncharacterized protein n=1 Tax=Sordaria macrospora TaxID=5147 RepID=A0A8S8ZXV7_SORMA|nr:hypothetical protein SMACR_01407 [Sordaria macrospora]KAH7634495.1 hypothetical protein B0T09DRAFT_6662 [Sordaria sp. MPI-SDFR-AT-0083]WPJ58712.1 hypothetical protein SMAC4_01407 [Sordaria macrospora]
MYPQALPNPDPDHDPDIDRDSWATFTNANRYNPRGQTQGKQQRPSGLLFLPNSNIASSPTLGPVPDPDPYPYPYPHTTRAVESNPSSYDTTTTSDRLTQAQAQTQIHGSHDSYSSSFYSTPSLYDDNNNTRVRFDYRDLPSPLSPPPLLPRSSSSGAGGLKYSLPPRPRTTLRVVDEETLNRLEGISEEGFLSGSGNGIGSGSGNWTGIGISDRGGSGSRSGNGIGDGGDNREEEDVELDEIPISPLPPAPAWLGRPSDRVIGEPEGYGYTEGPTRVQTEGQQQQEQEWRYGGWGREQEQQHGQEVRETRSTGKKNGRTRVTRWPGMWGIGSGSGSGSGYVGHKEKDMDGQCTSSRHRHGGFRARSTRLFSTIGAWLNGIDNGGRNDGTRHQRDGYGFRSRNGSGGHPWDSQQWDMV